MKSIALIKTILNGRNKCEVKIKDSEGNDIITTIIKNEGINTYNIKEKLIEILPKQYVEILQFSNGMELFNYDNIDGLKLLSAEEIEKYTLYAKNTFEDDWQDNIIIFAKVIGEDNYLGFRMKDGCEIIDCYFEELPSEWKIISNSIDNFLENYINKQGVKFWI